MRRVRVRCLTPGLAFSAFLVVMLQWYTLQVRVRHTTINKGLHFPRYRATGNLVRKSMDLARVTSNNLAQTVSIRS